MANEDQGDWFGVAWEVAKVALASLGSAASAAVLWLSRNYRSHLAMLKRHEERLNDNDRELGTQREHRSQVGKGPMGEALVREFEALKAEDQRLHRRVSRRKQEQAQTDRKIASMETDIKWIRRHLENGGREE